MELVRKVLTGKYMLSEKEWNIAKEYVEMLELRRNEFMLQKGRVCRKLGLVEAGVLRYCMFTDEGEDITCYFLSEEDFVGDYESFLTGEPSNLNLQALTDCRVTCFDKKLLQALPRFTEILETINKSVLMSLLNQREFMINQDAATRYELFMEKYPKILQRIPLGYIASYLGITQQSLSRLRKNIS